MRWMDCQGLRCIWMSARLAGCQFLIKLWPHINICQCGGGDHWYTTAVLAANKYAKFYGKLTNLYIKNAKNFNKLHGNYSPQTGKRVGGFGIVSPIRHMYEDGKNVCIIVHNLLACQAPRPAVSSHLEPCLATPFEATEHPKILSCFSCAICQLTHFLFVSPPGERETIMKQKSDRFNPPEHGKPALPKRRLTPPPANEFVVINLQHDFHLHL